MRHSNPLVVALFAVLPTCAPALAGDVPFDVQVTSFKIAPGDVPAVESLLRHRPEWPDVDAGDPVLPRALESLSRSHHLVASLAGHVVTGATTPPDADKAPIALGVGQRHDGRMAVSLTVRDGDGNEVPAGRAIKAVRTGEPAFSLQGRGDPSTGMVDYTLVSVLVGKRGDVAALLADQPGATFLRCRNNGAMFREGDGTERFHVDDVIRTMCGDE